MFLYKHGNRASLAAACREIAGVIGPHGVGELDFRTNPWGTPDVGVIFEAAPSLKYAEGLVICCHNTDVSTNCEAFMNNLAAIKSLRLRLDYDSFRQFSGTFLRREAALDLRRIEFKAYLAWNENTNELVGKFVRDSLSLPRLQGRLALELDFSENSVYALSR